MLVEREEPLSALFLALDEARKGQGRVALVMGEAGIGKSSVLREFVSSAQKDSSVHCGACEAFFTARALGPLHDVAHGLGPHVAELLRRSAPPEQLFPAVLDSLQDNPRTSVLVFEDMHWADKASLDLVRYLGRRAGLLRLLMILSFRSEEVGPDHPLAQVIGDLPSQTVARVRLQPLSPQGVATLARVAGRVEPDLHRLTAGNPFFVTEILASDEPLTKGIPPSIRDAVWSRLSRLDEEDREALEALSVEPAGIEPWLAEALLGPDAEVLVDNCVERGLLVRDINGNLQFRHELARQSTLERVSAARRRKLHRQVLSALDEAAAESGEASLSRRVHHAAGAGEARRVLELAPQAAAHAASLGAHQQAASHLETALEYVGKAPQELAAQLCEDWAYEAGIALQIDDLVIEWRHRAVELWRQLGRLDKVGENLRWLARLHWYRGDSQEAGRYADEAIRVLESLPPGPELATAYALRSQLHMLNDRFAEAVGWGNRAIELAEAFNATETLAHALNTVATALLHSDQPGGCEMMERSLALALQHGHHEQAARAYTNYGEYAVLFKDFPLAERLLAEGIAYDTKHDLDAWTHYLVGRLAQLRLEQGRLRDAETIAAGVMKLERLTLIMQLPALLVLGRARTRLGESDAPLLLQQALRNALSTGEPQYIAPARLALVEAAWLSGDLVAAHEQLAQLAAMDLDAFDRWEFGELVVWWQRCHCEPPQFPVDRAAQPRLMELKGNPEGAADKWLGLGLPYEAALSLMRVEGDDAEVALSRAATILQELGATPALRLARRKAELLGVADRLPKVRRGPYASARAHPFGLTRRELEVLRLIAEGAGNREIAARLVRSPRTIEHHVSAVLAKLRAANRMEVMLRLRNEPWLLQEAEPGRSAKSGYRSSRKMGAGTEAPRPNPA